MAITELAGDVAVVTGGNGGIGLGMAKGLASAGADVCIWGRDETKNKAAVEALGEFGTHVEALRCDVGREDDVVEAFATTLERFEKVDSCIANAGMGGIRSAFPDVQLDDWRRVLSVNLDGVMLTLREAARHMIERGEGGSLVAVSSTASMHGVPLNHAYAVSKIGVLALVRALAVELARHRIRCNSVLPGWTDTDMIENGKQAPKWVENTIKRTPVRRWADPDEFGPVAVFLARRDVTFHTGDELVVDGGYTRF